MAQIRGWPCTWPSLKAMLALGQVQRQHLHMANFRVKACTQPSLETGFAHDQVQRFGLHLPRLRGRACTWPSFEAKLVHDQAQRQGLHMAKFRNGGLRQFQKDLYITSFRQDLRTVKSCCFDSTLKVKAHNFHIPVMWLNQYEKHNWKI